MHLLELYPINLLWFFSCYLSFVNPLLARAWATSYCCHDIGGRDDVADRALELDSMPELKRLACGRGQHQLAEIIELFVVAKVANSGSRAQAEPVRPEAMMHR